MAPASDSDATAVADVWVASTHQIVYDIRSHKERSLRKAQRLFYSREQLADGTILELRLWLVPEPVPPSRHRFKYALFYGRPGERLVLFDNERGKGDHVHIGDIEQPYHFRGPDRLVADFLAAVNASREEKPDE